MKRRDCLVALSEIEHTQGRSMALPRDDGLEVLHLTLIIHENRVEFGSGISETRELSPGLQRLHASFHDERIRTREEGRVASIFVSVLCFPRDLIQAMQKESISKHILFICR